MAEWAAIRREKVKTIIFLDYGSWMTNMLFLNFCSGKLGGKKSWQLTDPKQAQH